MAKITRWFNKRRKVVWAEPGRPRFVKINPNSPPGVASGLQPGDITMAVAAREFLEADETSEPDPSAPEPGEPVLARQQDRRPYFCFAVRIFSAALLTVERKDGSDWALDSTADAICSAGANDWEVTMSPPA